MSASGIRGALLAAGVPSSIATREAPLAERAMREAEITTTRRATYFLAQVLHESGGLRYFEEIASGDDYEGRRDLGNTQPGDGRRFKGRGPIQLTGRANYRAAGKALGLPLESNPKIAARHEVGWRVAAWFWRHGTSEDLNWVAEHIGFKRVTRLINGGYNGLEDRQRYLRIVSRFDVRPGSGVPRLTEKEGRLAREIERLRDAKRDEARRSEIKRWLRTRANELVKAVKKSPRSRLNDNRRERIAFLRDVAFARNRGIFR